MSQLGTSGSGVTVVTSGSSGVSSPSVTRDSSVSRDLAGTQVVGGLAIGTVGAGIYAGFTLSAGDDFLSLDIVSPTNPRGKYFTSRTYQGGGGCRGPATGALAIEYDVSPEHTGWNDSNRGVPIPSLSTSHTIVPGEGTGALRLLAIRQTAGEQTLLNTGVAGQIERTAMLSGVSAFWWDSPSVVEWRAALPSGPVGQHPDMWGLSSEPPNGPNLTGNEYGWECGNTKTGAYHNDWAGGTLTGSETDITNYREGSYHTFTVVLSAVDYKWYVDGTLVKTYNTTTPDSEGNKADHMLMTHHILNAAYQGQTYASAAWDPGSAPNGAVMDIEWFRVWRQTSGTNYAPVSTIQDVLVNAGDALNIVLPAQSALWGATGLTEFVTCVQNEVEEPGSSNTVSYAQFPTGIIYTSGTRTLSGTMPAQSGALYVVVGVKGNGNTCQPARFRIVSAPVYKGAGGYSWTKNVAVNQDIYVDWDCGRLFLSGSNPKGLVVTGLPAGLSFSSTTGLITGTPTSSVGGNLSLSATNSAGQTTSVTPTYVVLDPAKGAVAPTLTGNPVLKASWDFDQAATITASGGSIDSIVGSDGTFVTLSNVGGGTARPTVSTRTANGVKGIADLASASSQFLSLASGMGLGTPGCTIVVIAEPKATNTSCSLFTISQAAATAIVNRTELGQGSGATGWSMRKCGATGGNFDANQGIAYNAALTLAIGRSRAGTATATLNVDGVGTTINSGGSTTNPAVVDTTLLGCRSVAGVKGNFANMYVWRVLVYLSELTDVNLEEIAVWANTNYATTNSP